MRLNLHHTVIEISADTPSLREACRRLFTPAFHSKMAPDLRLELNAARERLDEPSTPPLFVDTRNGLSNERSRLSVFAGRHSGRVILFFPEGGVAEVPLTGSSAPALVRATVHAQLVACGRLEDLIWTALAPLLRRRGAYLVHAFGAQRDGEAVLLVGPSGSGKTTTGLLLLKQGWQLLGNDIVLLYRGEGKVWASPMPGHVTVSERTLSLLPELSPLVTGTIPGLDGKWQIDSRHVYSGPPPKAAPVTNIFFPTMGTGERSVRRRESAGVALARLTEESVDRWDPETMPAHLTLLQAMVEQARTWRLELAPDVARIPGLIEGG